MLCPKCNRDVPKLKPSAGTCYKCFNHDYYLSHKEHIIANAKQWAANNPERARAIWHKHSQKQNTGRKPGTPRYEGPCISCGTMEPIWKYFVKQLCRPCYKKAEWSKKHPKTIHIAKCVDCGTEKPVEKGNGPMRCKACYMRWRRENVPGIKEHQREVQETYRKTPDGAERCRMHLRKRRAVLAGATSSLTKEEWEDILLQHDYSCAYCGSKERIELDHVVPISKGGTHTKDNVLPCCRKCNATKQDKPLDQFLAIL